MQAIDAQLTIEAPSQKEIDELGTSLNDVDIFVYCGEITYDLFDVFYDFARKRKRNRNVTLILSTPGGNPDAAYRIARYLRTTYDKFTLVVPTDCKSAGTLIACGAHEIAMTHKGEFGPLDVQVFSPDEFLQRSSGITITQALKYLEERAFDAWEESFLKVRSRSGGVITTKTASEIAAAISVGIYSPISDKIEPGRIGDLQRSCDIALQYGIRLGMAQHMVQHLIHGYPSHGFVIDYREAKQIFSNVRLASPVEMQLLSGLCDITSEELSHRLDDRLSEHEDYLMSVDFSLAVKTKKKHENDVKGGKKNRRSVEGTSNGASGGAKNHGNERAADKADVRP